MQHLVYRAIDQKNIAEVVYVSIFVAVWYSWCCLHSLGSPDLMIICASGPLAQVEKLNAPVFPFRYSAKLYKQIAAQTCGLSIAGKCSSVVP